MKHSHQTKDRCYQLRAAGANFEDIARVCNISEKTARAWCHDHPEEIEKWLNDDEREFIYFHRHLLATKVERIDDLTRKLMDRLHRDEVGMGMMPYEKAARLLINLTNISTKLMHIGIPKEATFPVRMRQTHIHYQKLTRTQLAQQKETRKQKRKPQKPAASQPKSGRFARAASKLGSQTPPSGPPICNRRPAHHPAKAAATTPNAHPSREASSSAVAPDSFCPLPTPPPLTGNNPTPKPSVPPQNRNKSTISPVHQRQTKPKKPVTPSALGAPLSKRPKPHNPKADVSTPNAQLPREASLEIPYNFST